MPRVLDMHRGAGQSQPHDSLATEHDSGIGPTGGAGTYGITGGGGGADGGTVRYHRWWCQNLLCDCHGEDTLCCRCGDYKGFDLSVAGVRARAEAAGCGDADDLVRC